MFLDLVHLILTTTWYTCNSPFYHKLMLLQWEDQHLPPQERFICRLMNILLYLGYYSLQKFGNNLFIRKCTHWGNFFPSHQQSSSKYKFTMEEENNEELAFLDTSLKRNNREISLLVYRKPAHTDQYLP